MGCALPGSNMARAWHILLVGRAVSRHDKFARARAEACRDVFFKIFLENIKLINK